MPIARLLLLALALLPTPEAHAGNASWPDPPPVRIAWRSRDATDLHHYQLAADEWTTARDRRVARVERRIDDVAFLVWFEQFENVDATRVTVAAINGFRGVGPRYFEEYEIEVDGRMLEDLHGRHVILPRGALIRRGWYGPRRNVLRNWTFVQENRPVPEWAPAKAVEDTLWRMSFPHQDQAGHPVDLGPYNFFWRNHGFHDSHGGWGIGPFHGGPDDWLQCPEGRQNREAEMLLEFQRPIWMLTGDFEPAVLQVPYWMGRTQEHEPVGYRYEVDDWCRYAERLSEYQFADFTHLSRGTSGAAAVAEWDAFGVFSLEMVLADFKTANSLTRVVGEDEFGNPVLHPGATQNNELLYPLWKKLEVVDGPESPWGDRGLAHWLRLVRWCRPHVRPEELEPWEDALRLLARRLSDQYGVTSAREQPHWVLVPGGPLSAPLEGPICQTFHQQLVTYECRRFGGLDVIANAGKHFLSSEPPQFFEVRAGAPGDTVFDRHHSADAQQDDPLWGYAPYGNFTHDVLNEFDDPSNFLEYMRLRGVNGSSQDLDSTPRAVWEPGL